MSGGAAPETLADGRYQVRGPLGAGGMASVWRVFDTRLGVERAVKILDAALVRSRSQRERFENEARAMARARHRNVVVVHDVVNDGERSWLVMELLEGGSLFDRVRNEGPMSGLEACEVLGAVLEGLAVAHRLGVVHRDVKPQNVLFDVDGTPKISDFGIAHLPDHSLTRTGAVMGTLPYMPPEQRHDASGVGPSADIFAMGATLFAVVTGLEPVDLWSTEQRNRMPLAIPAPIRVVIERACAFEAADRYPDADAMRDALAAVAHALRGEGPSVARPSLDTLSDECWDTTPRVPFVGFVQPPPTPTPTGVGRTRGRVGVLAGLGCVGVLGASVAMGAVSVGFGLWAGPGVAVRPVLPLPPVPLTVPVEAGTLAADAPSDLAAPLAPTGEAPRRPAPAARPAPDVTAPPPAIFVVAPPAADPEPEPSVVPPKGIRVFVNARPRASVWVDGVERGPTPADLRLSPGPHDLVVTSDAGATVSRRLVVDEEVRFCWDFAVGGPCPR